MKILFFFPRLNKYLYFKPLINICRYLYEAGIEVVIATSHDPSALQIKNFDDTVQFLVQPPSQSRILWVISLLSDNYSCFIGVQAHNAIYLALCKLVFLKRKKKIVSWEHSSPVSSLKGEKGFFFYPWLVLRIVSALFIDRFFCVSRGAVEEMNKLSNDKKVKYVPNIVYEDGVKDYCDVRAKTFNDNFIFISVGRLSREKGIELALDALSQLDRFKWEYWIVGDGPLMKDILDQIATNTLLSERVKVMGRQENVLSLMAQSDLLILPSYFEGLPTVLVEASLVNLPVVASNCKTGPSEIIVEGVNGFLFDVGNVEELKDKIIQWYERRDKIINNARFVLDYGWEAGGCFLDEIEALVSV